MTPLTESQLKAIGLPDDTYQQIVNILEEALSAKDHKAKIDPVLFDRFWAQFPSRLGGNPKAPAKAKFESAVRNGTDAEIIIEGAKRYRADLNSRCEENTKYVCQALTWLNQRRWEEYHISTVPQKTEIAHEHLDPSWIIARSKLAEQLGQDIFYAWFSTVKFIVIDPPSVRLSVDTTFRKRYIENKFYQHVLMAWKMVNNTVDHVEFTIAAN